MPSRSDQPTNCCCSCCRSLILFGFSFLFTFLLYRATTKDPRIYLSDIRTTGSGANITCQIEIKNRALLLGIHYDDLLVSVTYPQEASSDVASAVVPAFYQGFHKRAFKETSLLGGPWAKAKAAAAANNGSAALLRVGVNTKFRLKAALIYKSKRYGLSVTEDVQVNADGKMTAPDHILLNSAATRGTRSCMASWPVSVAAGTMAVLAMLSII